MNALPRIMVAPNGARLTKADHPAVPVTIEETVETAVACRKAGAGGIHAHIRDGKQHHLLDAGLYRELIDEIHRHLPGFVVQVTTESVGSYTPPQQRALVYDLVPSAVSIALREITADGDEAENRQLFHWAAENRIAVQHIVYDPSEVLLLGEHVKRHSIPATGLQLLFVLGRYTESQVSHPGDILPFLAALKESALEADWAVCAFGINETDCLIEASRLGGKMRVGFENNTLNADGSEAVDNAERVKRLCEEIGGTS